LGDLSAKKALRAQVVEKIRQVIEQAGAIQSGEPGLGTSCPHGVSAMDQGGYLGQLLRYPDRIDAVKWLNFE